MHGDLLALLDLESLLFRSAGQSWEEEEEEAEEDEKDVRMSMQMVDSPSWRVSLFSCSS